jgi:hypothetical protein
MYLNANQSRQSNDIAFVTSNTMLYVNTTNVKDCELSVQQYKVFSCFLRVSDFGFNVGLFSLSDTNKAISYITEDIIFGDAITLIMV